MTPLGLTEQAPRKIFVLTTTQASVPRMRGAEAKPARRGFLVGDAVYQFIQVRPEMIQENLPGRIPA